VIEEKIIMISIINEMNFFPKELRKIGNKNENDSFLMHERITNCILPVKQREKPFKGRGYSLITKYTSLLLSIHNNYVYLTTRIAITL
jgi:hypothetical protein